MSTINEIIQRQAAAVKQNSNALAAAEHLEKAAKLLRQGAQASQGAFKVDFSAIPKAKADRIAKFNASVREGYLKELEAKLERFGWVPGRFDEKENKRYFGNSKKRGFRLIVSGNHFSVHHGEEIKLAKTEISFIDDYLQSAK